MRDGRQTTTNKKIELLSQWMLYGWVSQYAQLAAKWKYLYQILSCIINICVQARLFCWQGIARHQKPDKKESTSSSGCRMCPPPYHTSTKIMKRKKNRKKQIDWKSIFSIKSTQRCRMCLPPYHPNTKIQKYKRNTYKKNLFGQNLKALLKQPAYFPNLAFSYIHIYEN